MASNVAFELDVPAPWSTANEFGAGHGIRVDSASASFPRRDRSLNMADAADVAGVRPARQTILHEAAHPFHIALPVLLAESCQPLPIRMPHCSAHPRGRAIGHGRIGRMADRT